MQARMLQAAVAAARVNDVDGCIAHLLSTWRATRATRIAGLLDVATAHLGRAAMVARDDAEDDQDAWLEIALMNRPEGLPALLPRLVVDQPLDDVNGDRDYDAVNPAAIRSAERVWAL